ncbi:DUF4190 domain-containing protein [Glycomyces sp. L485]|uniref:DUF4190 domain-containing protein n=1 Tax=Glycomyces sp. L485 TaxID=2909235 RepID=UPI001F4AE135|nr:DUF4190 domain-containing protein [Glycomyces sp. L485]MCH7230226.1 DUF4190 domain-containing protein [Glycomyces sp. L485]
MTSQSEQPEQQPPPGPPPPMYPYPPMYGYPYYQPPPPMNGMAIAAMILGIVGVFSPIGVLGLIFGMVAKRQIRERGERGDGFAVTGIVLGWIAVASIVFWALYIILIFTATGFVVNEITDYEPDSWPTDDATDFALLLL